MAGELTYVLAVLSHGDPESPTAYDTLASFVRRVRPSPTMTVYYHDGPGVGYCGEPQGQKWYRHEPGQVGFCHAVGRLWRQSVLAAESVGATHVFWLEHDFRFVRSVDLEMMSRVLRDREIAQVALMRQPVNSREKAAGGVVAQHPDRWSLEELVDEDGRVWEWLRHRNYFTTNPSLMTVDFMVRDPWPPIEEECEGRYGIDLVDHGYHFAVWGDGEVWVRHTGVRTGEGY